MKIFFYIVLDIKSHWNNFWLCSREKTILSCLEKHEWYIVIKLEIFQMGYLMILSKNMKFFNALF